MFLRRLNPPLLLIIVVLLLAATHTQPAAAAANGVFTSFTPNAASGCIFGIGNYGIQVNGTTDDGGGLDYVAVILRDAAGNYGDNDFWGAGATAVGATFSDATGFNSPPAARPFTLELYDIGSPVGTSADSPAGVALTRAGTLLTSYTFDPLTSIPACASLPLLSASAPGSPGPVLPGPEDRNLVLIIGDIGISDSPNGNPVNADAVLRRCQTVFVIGENEDATWYKVFLMGGWIPAAATIDVPEDYGQATFPANCS